MPVYADDGLYLFSGNDRASNQVMIEEKFRAIKEFLVSNDLAVNDGKTSMTEFMLKQKRRRIRGIPPKLVVQVLEDGAIVDKMITDKTTCRF